MMKGRLIADIDIGGQGEQIMYYHIGCLFVLRVHRSEHRLKMAQSFVSESSLHHFGC